MRYVLLSLGSICAILFIIQLIKGRKYETVINSLNGGQYLLCDLYAVGFSWSSTKLFPFRGKRASELKAQAALLYDAQFADYYANVAWAQTLTFVHLFITVTFLMAGLMFASVTFMLTVGIFLTVLIGVYCFSNMGNTLDKRAQECESQLPEVVSTMAILVNSGMVLREAWATVSENGVGEFYELMRKAGENMNNGYSDNDAIFMFGKSSNSSEVKKFTSALLQSMEKGGGELGVFLAQQSSELWSTKRQKMLQGGEKAATKLLLPIVLIFIGIIIIVMTAAFAGTLF